MPNVPSSSIVEGNGIDPVAIAPGTDYIPSVEATYHSCFVWKVLHFQVNPANVKCPMTNEPAAALCRAAAGAVCGWLY